MIKKLISLLIILATITIAGMTSVMASFAVQNVELAQEKEIVVQNMCCEEWVEKSDQKLDILCNDWGVCSDGSICECCIELPKNYPYFSRSDNTNIKKKLKNLKIIDYAFIDLLQEDLNINLVARLNSPPKLPEPFILNNLYIALTGSIKSNC